MGILSGWSLNTLHITLPIRSCLWSTIRFRPSKHQNGWVLLGIPKKLQYLVINCLNHIGAQILDSYDNGDFISVLLEAPPQVLDRLAYSFPPPNGMQGAKTLDLLTTIHNLNEQSFNNTKP